MTYMKLSTGVTPASAYVEFEGDNGMSARSRFTLAELRAFIAQLQQIESDLTDTIRAEEKAAAE